jgi:D-methionine transport system permease protein
MNSENLSLALNLIPKASIDTLYMVALSSFFALLIGLPLGIILYLTGKGKRKDSPLIYKGLSALVNIGRSFPFAILMIALIPFTRALVGTSLGTTAAIVPLSVAASPFFARVVEQCLLQVDRHVIEAVELMGASTKQLILKVLLKEPLPSLILGFGNMAINLIGYSAMAGLVGGGGLGKVAIQYGYNQFNLFIMMATVASLIVLVEAVQGCTNTLSQAILKKRGITGHE